MRGLDGATLTGRHAASARARAGKPELQASRRLLDGLYPAGRRQGPLAGAADACEVRLVRVRVRARARVRVKVKVRVRVRVRVRARARRAARGRRACAAAAAPRPSLTKRARPSASGRPPIVSGQ